MGAASSHNKMLGCPIHAAVSSRHGWETTNPQWRPSTPFDSPQKPGCPILRASCEGWEPEAAKDAFREIISILKDLSNRHPDRYSAALTNAESTLAQIEKETEKR